jgi:hypothetical protein
MDVNTSNTQFNTYKYAKMSREFEMLVASTSIYQMELGQSVLQEWCWTYSRDELIGRWLQNYHEPKSALIPLSILQYNIRYFYSSQYELLDMIIRYNPTIISLNEMGTIIPRKTLEKLLFSYNIFMKQGSNN